MKKQVLYKVFEAVSKSCDLVMEQKKVGGDHSSSSEACVKALVLSETISRHNCRLEWVSDQRHRWQKLTGGGKEAFVLSFLDIWTVTMIVMKEQRPRTREGVGWNGENKRERGADGRRGEERGGGVMSARARGEWKKWRRWKKRKSTSEEESERAEKMYVMGFYLYHRPSFRHLSFHVSCRSP